MAHFAKLENNIVTQVIVVDNNDILDANGNESEEQGKEFCTNLLGGEWIQTSYNGNIRKNYAGIGDTYDATRDAFISQKPFPSWILDEDTCRWNSPVPYPTLTEEDVLDTVWNEFTNEWVKIYPDYVWNEELINWELVNE